MKINKLIIILTVVVVIGIGVYAITQTNKTQQEKKIVTTIFPIYDIAKNIAGEEYEVVQLLPVGASPHTYEPSVSDLEKASGSEMMFVIGLDLDNWATELVDTADVIELHEKIDLIEEEDHEEDGNEEEHEHEEGNPHYWLSIKNAKQIATTIAQSLKQADAPNSSYYDNNLNSYLSKLAQLEIQINESLSGLTNQQKQIITFHDAFAYFARDFELEIVATIEPFPGKEPTVNYLAEVNSIIEQLDIKVLYKEPQLSESVVSAIAADQNIEIYTLDPIGGVQNRNSYIELMLYNASTISIAQQTVR